MTLNLWFCKVTIERERKQKEDLLSFGKRETSTSRIERLSDGYIEKRIACHSIGKSYTGLYL